MENNSGLVFFEKYLTLWVTACIIIGIAIGKWLPAIPSALGELEYYNVSLPIAVLIWLMIYPMMLKIDFQSIRNVGKNPKGLVVTCCQKRMWIWIFPGSMSHIRTKRLQGSSSLSFADTDMTTSKA